MSSTSGNVKQKLIVLLCTGIAVGLFALGYLTDPLVLVITSLFIPMVFAFIRAQAKLWETFLCLAVMALCVFFIAGAQYVLIMLAITVPVTLITGQMIKQRSSFYYTVLASCAAVLLSLGFLVFTVYMLWDKSLDGLLLDYVEKQLVSNPELAKLYYFMLGALQGGTMPDVASLDLKEIFAVPAQTAVAGIMRTIEPGVLLLLPELSAAAVALFGLLNYIIPRGVLRKMGRSVGAIPVFSMWSLPLRFGTWSLILIVISYIGNLAGWNNFELVYVIVMGFLGITYTVQGMAFVSWLLKKKIDARATRVAVIVVTFVLFSMVNLSSIYMFVGFFEQIIKLRKREQLSR